MSGKAPRVAVVMGVSGSGKTTIAQGLAAAWPARFLDADDFHSARARARMAGGQPLTDAMRRPWVLRLRAELERRVGAGERVCLAFSGLRRQHRDLLRATGLPLRFVFLQGGQALIASRMRARSGHYMPVSLLQSQFDALEEPVGEADVAVVSIDAPAERVVACALAALEAPGSAPRKKNSP